MTSTDTRASNSRRDKFGDRRRELADAALAAVAEHGFANTGLRDIAARTSLSHGVLHYYFADKDDLIGQAIWQYKSQCARRYDPIVETARTAEEFIERFAAELASTLGKESSLHRLWYDLRNQALFDAGFHETVERVDALLEDMVWAVVNRYAQLSDRQLLVGKDTAYSLFDGLFQNARISLLRGALAAPRRLSSQVGPLLASTLAP